MLLKEADDKTKRLQLLEELQQTTVLGLREREWVQKEMIRTRKGIEGERSAAHYLNNFLASSPHSVLMHDLRFEVNGEIAQIDHMLLTRVAGILLFETKNFSGNLSINPHGEFSVAYGAQQFGIPSPIEQSCRHENVLRKLLVELEITSRIGGRMEFHHLVLVDPKATISRPPNKAFDTSMVIKADQFPEWHRRFANRDISVLEAFKGLANIRGADTVRLWGEKLLQQHKPADLLALPDFIIAKFKTASALTSTPAQGLVPEKTRLKPAPSHAASETRVRKLVCAHCGSKISYPEGKFCWSNERRFGGTQYCREHQAFFK